MRVWIHNREYKKDHPTPHHGHRALINRYQSVLHLFFKKPSLFYSEMIKFVRISLITFYVMLPQSTYPLILNGGFNYSPLVLDAKLLEPVVFRPVSFSYHPWTFIFNPAFKNYKLYRKGNFFSGTFSR